MANICAQLHTSIFFVVILFVLFFAQKTKMTQSVPDNFSAISPATPHSIRQSWAAQPVDFFDAIRICLNKYADFKGRASRSEFWFFTLAQVILSALATQSEIIFLALLLPGLAVSARRLHDTGKSGWWQVLPMSLFLGSLAMTALAYFDSVSDNNEKRIVIVLAALLWLASIVIMMILFFAKGQDAPNRFDKIAQQ